MEKFLEIYEWIARKVLLKVFFVAAGLWLYAVHGDQMMEAISLGLDSATVLYFTKQIFIGFGVAFGFWAMLYLPAMVIRRVFTQEV